MSVPKGTLQPIVDKLEATLAAFIMQSPGAPAHERWAAGPTQVQAYTAFVKSELDNWTRGDPDRRQIKLPSERVAAIVLSRGVARARVPALVVG